MNSTSNYTYTPGGASLKTSGEGYAVQDTPQGDNGFTEFLKQLMLTNARRAAATPPPPAFGRPVMGGSGYAQRAPLPQYHSDSVDPMARQVSQMEALARIKQLQAAMNPPPMHMVGGGSSGYVPGYMPDPLMMNAYQRQLYLPQGSGMTGGGQTVSSSTPSSLDDYYTNRSHYVALQSFQAPYTSFYHGASYKSPEEIQAENIARTNGGQR